MPQETKATPGQRFQDALKKELLKNWPWYNAETARDMADRQFREYIGPILRALQNAELQIAEGQPHAKN